ncbi:MAG: LPS export ABC transporter periplasmic protein LptC [Nitrospirae bacterium GWC2_57_13]|jgi:LPS export ABC transporter protein LptC|nr:MAG: LPS export ABC transporter periplasmic protein LptC [Nitrospirae bacterium GWC2_57_13]HAS55177.1 LPS export ABC transporter periplasmic protein LptC [Nitrospiraceae bacterium]
MKAGTRKAFKAGAAVLVLLSAYGVLSLLRGRAIDVPELLGPPAGAKLQISMDGFRFTQSENGRVSLRVNAGSADLYENKEARLKDLEIVFSSPDRGDAALRGEVGVLDTSTGDAVIRSVSRDVRIVTHDGYLLTTQSLSWKAADRVVRTAEPFKLLGPEIYLEGRGITANIEKGTVAVEGNVKAVLQE